jgi:hypothetical protein
MEHTGCNEACKCSSKDVARVQDSNSRGNLLSRVKDAQEVHGSGVVWSLCEA